MIRRPPISPLFHQTTPVLSFFQRYGDPRDLHSFPTRRSSDLDIDIFRAELPMIFQAHPISGIGDGAYWNGVGALSRSEEHTYELQSLMHLVCRLLLCIRK